VYGRLNTNDFGVGADGGRRGGAHRPNT